MEVLVFKWLGVMLCVYVRVHIVSCNSELNNNNTSNKDNDGQHVYVKLTYFPAIGSASPTPSDTPTQQTSSAPTETTNTPATLPFKTEKSKL